MNASGLKLNSSLIAGSFIAVTLLFGASMNPTYGQPNPVPAAQVIEMVSRVKAASPGEQLTLKAAVPLGQRLLVEQRYGEAYELFSAILGKWPREATALYGLALAAFNLGHSAEAEPHARLAAEIYLATFADQATARSVLMDQRIQGADALVLLAIILGAEGKDTEALKTVERAASLAPENFDAQFTLGRALYSVGESAAAVKAFRIALQLKPDDARALFFLATALEQADNSDAALSAYRELIARHPQLAEGHLGSGVLLIKRGGSDAEKGIQELQSAVRIDPDLYEAQVTLGRALLTRKLAAESVAHLQQAAKLAPNNPEPHYQLTLAYRRLGMDAKAAEESAIVKRIHEQHRGEATQNNSATRPNQ